MTVILTCGCTVDTESEVRLKDYVAVMAQITEEHTCIEVQQ